MRLASLSPLLRHALPLTSLAAIALLARDAHGQTTVSGSATAPTFAPAADATAAPAPAPATAPATASDAAEETPEDATAREWTERDRMLDEGTAINGGVGLLHVQHAQGGAPGQLRIAFTTEYFSGGFLCTPGFPCQNPLGSGSLTDDKLSHVGGTLALSGTFTKWLEGYVSTGAFANSDAANRPSLVQVLGDVDLGLKAYGALNRWLHVGGGAELWLINGTGGVGLDGGGTSAKFRGLATADLRGLEKSAPLRFSLNATYALDNTGQVVSSTESARGAIAGTGTQPITRIERFGLGINRVDHVDLGVGAEVFLADERIRPFAEYNILLPVNRQGYTCKAVNINSDNCLGNHTVTPSKITIGSRFLPWKHGFNILAAFDIGVSGTSNFIEEVAPQAPWTLYIGAGWAIDTQDRPPVVQTKIVDHTPVAPVADHARVKGLVHEAGKADAIANAIVVYDGHPELTSLATSADGRFRTEELPEGTWAFTVHADGYKDGKCSGTLARVPATASPPADPKAPPTSTPSALTDVQIDCALEALPRVGRVVGHVRDADSQAAVANATVTLTDSNRKDSTTSADASGAFHFDGIAPGNVTLTAESDGFMNQVQTTDVKSRTDNTSDIVLHHRPKNPQVAITAKEITIKQQIQFATDSATILPASDGLLTEIADVFIHNPRIRRVEIQGHTDSEGADDHNQVLSDERANSVRVWLVQHGVAADRLVAKGYGEKKPLVPNVTPAARQRNRRVQFVILEQDPAAPAAK